jgi:hypothetical protein
MDRVSSSSNRLSDRLMIALTAMLAANLGVTLINSFQPGVAIGQVHSYSRVAGESTPTPVSQAATSNTVPTSVEQLRRMADQLEAINTRMGAVERKLDGELKVRVTNFPADKSK